VNAVHSDTESLFTAAAEMASSIAENPPIAVEGTKNVLNWTADHTTASGLDYVAAWNAAFLQSKDLTEAIMAFMERREPVFTGE
jgi:enoyl-CoA hydratase